MNKTGIVSRESAPRLLKAAMLFVAMLVALVYWNVYCHNSIYFCSFFLVAALITIIYQFAPKLIKSEFWHGNAAFLACLSLMGVIFIFMFPPGSVPDEPYHFWSSYALSDVITGREIDYDTASIAMREVDAVANLNSLKDLTKDSLRATVTDFALVNNNQNWAMMEIPKDALDFGANPVYIKLPSAMAITIAKFLNIGFYPLFFFGRLVNYALFCIFAITAVRITPIAKQGFMIVSLLPMTLHLAASYSYDVGIISLSLLLISLMLRLLVVDNQSPQQINSLLVAVFVCAVLLAPCKVIYFISVFLLFLVPISRFGSKKKAWLFRFSVLLAGLAFILFMRSAFLTNLADAPSNSELDYRGTETGVFYTVSDAISNPFNTIMLFIRTIDQLGDYFIQTFVGGSLGWLQANLRIPLYYVFAYLAIIYLAFMANSEDCCQLSNVQRVTMAGIAAICWIGAMTSMYLGWTFNTESIILGIQGRYFLPICPLLFLSLRSSKIKYSGRADTLVLIGVLVLNYLTLIRTFSIALTA